MKGDSPYTAQRGSSTFEDLHSLQDKLSKTIRQAKCEQHAEDRAKRRICEQRKVVRIKQERDW